MQGGSPYQTGYHQRMPTNQPMNNGMSPNMGMNPINNMTNHMNNTMMGMQPMNNGPMGMSPGPMGKSMGGMYGNSSPGMMQQQGTRGRVAPYPNPQQHMAQKRPQYNPMAQQYGGPGMQQHYGNPSGQQHFNTNQVSWLLVSEMKT